MPSAITKLCDELTSSPSFCAAIPHFDDLLSALSELNGLIGLTNVKEDIIAMVKYIICRRMHGISEEGHKINTLLTGPPGTGKSNVGMLLARLWIALGMVTPRVTPLEHMVEASVSVEKVLLHPLHQHACGQLEQVNQARICLEARVVAQRERLQRLFHALTIQHFHCATIYRRIYEARRQCQDRRRFRDFDAAIVNMGGVRDGLAALLDAEFPAFLQPCCEGSLAARRQLTPSSLTVMATAPSCSPTIDTPSIIGPPPAKGIFRVLTKEMLVGQYVGQTGPLCRKVLDEIVMAGGVAFMDEFYNFAGGGCFAMEALTIINEYASKYPQHIGFIFAGYKDRIENGPFRMQPGLARRLGWRYDIVKYTGVELAQIFTQQMCPRHRGSCDDGGWSVCPLLIPRLGEIFTQHKDDFPHFGGDTEGLVFQIKLAHSEQSFAKTLIDGKPSPLVVTEELLLTGIERFLKTRPEKRDEFIGLYT